MKSTNIPEVKLGIVAVSRDCFPIQLSEKRRAAIVAACQAKGLDLYLSLIHILSKPITAFAVMKLWEDGKLDLDAPVAAYLPEFGDAEHTNLTIRQLLCMTSGYGYNDNDSVPSAGLGRLYDEISESLSLIHI